MQTAGLADPEKVPKDRPFCVRDKLAAGGYILILLWVNAYICRELFHEQTASMASMHGFWIALAERASTGFHPTWWPYWNGGMPFEFTYAPLVPGLTAAWAAIWGLPHGIAFNALTAALYCLTPVSLFLMAWVLSRSAGYSFLAALFYSLTAPGQLLVPDGNSLKTFWQARRLILVALWDDTPHLAALTLLPVTIVFLYLAMRNRSTIYGAAAAISISLGAMASAFGPVTVAIAAFCLIAVLPRREYWRNAAVVIAIGAFGYALAARFLPPSLMFAMRSASEAGNAEGGTPWTMASITAMAIVALGWVILWRFLSRWVRHWWLSFVALFAFVMSSIPVLDAWLNRRFVPQPKRYQLEMELALSLLLVFAARPWLEKTPPAVKRTILFLVLALAGEQMVSHRQFAKTLLRPGDPAQTVEYRASMWAAQNLAGVRVMMPGSIAQWTNTFTDVQQFSGGSWSMASNPVQQLGLGAILNGGDTPERDARVALTWLKASGVGGIAVSGPESQEFWKPYLHPSKFEGILPVLWRDAGVTIYRVPLRSESLAHIIPESALLLRAPTYRGDTEGLDRYVAALDDASLDPADFKWEGNNRIHIRGNVPRGHALSVQVSHHPGWHATVDRRSVPLYRDGLGWMWLRPECLGPCEVQLNYDGGWELRLCRWLSYAAMISLFAVPLFLRLRR